MPIFLCAVSTDGTDPRAYALVEQNGDGPDRSYAVRDLGEFGDQDPVEHLQDVLAASEQYAGHTNVITMGGQPVADRFHEGGLTAVAVQTEAPASRDTDTIAVPEQQLVDTFTSVFRQGAVEVPGAVAGASEVLSALYNVMSDEAGAEEASEQMEALAESEATGQEVEPPATDGPNPAIIEQTGNAEGTSTARIGGDDRTERNQAFMPEQGGPRRHGRVDETADQFGPLDLGEHRGTALALGLAIWYGEYSTTDLPMTDQADETPRTRQIRRNRQEAARQRQR